MSDTVGLPSGSLPRRVVSVINGVRVAVNSRAATLPIINPVTEEAIGELIEADSGEVDAAVAAARTAFDRGPWPRLGLDARKDILYKIRDILREHRQELAYLECLHSGIPIRSIHEHVSRAAKNFEFFAEVASNLRGESYVGANGYLTYATREPKGVGALIAPWNAPLALASMRVATCIAFGNTCVLKPSEHTPLSMLRMVELFHEAGLPPGVVNLVNGRGGNTGASLVAHAGIDMVGFTGGTETGALIMSSAARKLKPSILELGGKSACIVHSSANLMRALDGVIAGIYANNGQQCLAGSRILLQRSIAEAFIASFLERCKRIRIGDPMEESTELGPLAFRSHMERVLSYVDIAKQEGAELLTGGGRVARFDKGYFIHPIAVLAPNNATRVCQEEIFGPFATFLVYDTVEQAIEIANDSPFGLVAYVWAQDIDAILRCSREIRAGTVWVNTVMMRELRAPFGGYKQSGVGRDGATSSVEFFTEFKTTTIASADVPLPNMGSEQPMNSSLGDVPTSAT